MTQAVAQGSTSTYSYDDQLNRVSQTVGGVTTIYPNKFYSVASSTSGGKSYSTTTVYVWNGDTLVATIDQAFINGTATGTAAMRYIHPDNLGSTNIFLDELVTIHSNVLFQLDNLALDSSFFLLCLRAYTGIEGGSLHISESIPY